MLVLSRHQHLFLSFVDYRIIAQTYENAIV